MPSVKRRKRKRPQGPPSDVRDANSQVVATFAHHQTDRGRGAHCPLLIATDDPHDRAHSIRRTIGEQELVPAPEAGEHRTVPRRYPACYMVGSNGTRVSFETAFDELAAREARLENMTLKRGRPFQDMKGVLAEAPRAMYEALARMEAAGQGRDRTRRVTRQAMTPEERRLESLGTQLLARAEPLA